MAQRDQLSSTEKSKVGWSSCVKLYAICSLIWSPFYSEYCLIIFNCWNELFCLLLFAQAALDAQVRDLTSRLDEEVANATKSAKREATKLKQRVRPTWRAHCHYLSDFFPSLLRSKSWRVSLRQRPSSGVMLRGTYAGDIQHIVPSSLFRPFHCRQTHFLFWCVGVIVVWRKLRCKLRKRRPTASGCRIKCVDRQTINRTFTLLYFFTSSLAELHVIQTACSQAW